MRHLRSTPRLPRLAAFLAAAVLVTAACGGGSAARSLPPAPVPAAGPPPAVAGAPGQAAAVAPEDLTPPPIPRGVLAGRVTAFSTNAPLARARVILSSDPAVLPFPRVLLTEADGTFRFTDLPASDGYLLTVTKTGYAPRGFGEAPPAVPPSLIPLGQDEVKEGVVVQLATQVSITGRVLDEDGTPFAGAFVEAMRAVFDGGRRTLVTVAEAITDDRGEFRLVGIPPGQYYLSAFDPAFSNVGDKDGQLFYSPTFYPGVVFPDEATRITLDQGAVSERLEFQLKIIRPARVQGSLTTPLEFGVVKPLLAAAVILSPLRNDQFSLFTLSQAAMNPDNSFLFANVSPGRYRIQARGETEREGVTRFSVFTISLDGGDRLNADMTLSQGAVVSGVVEWDTTTGRPPDVTTDIVVRMPMEDGNDFGDAVTGYLQPGDQWSINGVMAGRHYVRVDGLPPGWYLKRVEYRGADITDVTTHFEYDQVVPDFKVVLSNRATVVRGFVTPRGRDDVQSYAVVAFSTSPLHWTSQSRYTQLTYPDALGRYEFRGLPPGNYVVAATREVDFSDLSNPRVFDALLRREGVSTPFSLRESQVWRQDVVPLLRTRSTDGGR